VKKLIKKLLVFLVLGIPVFIFVDNGISYYRTESSELKFKEMLKSEEKANVVVFGSSHGEAGINPRYIEDEKHKIYNFCFSGAPPSYFKKWYEELFSRYYSRPDLIIFTVDWFMFDDEWLWRDFEFDSEYFPMNVLFRAVFDENINKEKLVKNRFSFMRMQGQVSMVDLFLSKQDVLGYYKGHYSYTIPAILTDQNRPNNIKEVNAFVELLDIFKKKKIKIVFVYTPELLISQERKVNSKNLIMLHNIAKVRGIPFLNYNEKRKSDINFNKELYIDWGHLNEEGSRQFSELLKKDLDVLPNYN